MAARLLLVGVFFLAVVVRAVVFFVREGRPVVAFAGAAVFRVVVAPRRAVFGSAGAISSSVAAAFRCVTRLGVVPFCWGFSSVLRCNVTTSV